MIMYIAERIHSKWIMQTSLDTFLIPELVLPPHSVVQSVYNIFIAKYCIPVHTVLYRNYFQTLRQYWNVLPMGMACVGNIIVHIGLEMPVLQPMLEV